LEPDARVLAVLPAGEASGKSFIKEYIRERKKTKLRRKKVYMKKQSNSETTASTARLLCRSTLFLSAALVMLACLASPARADDHSRDRSQPQSYCQVNLVSDLPGVAMLQDTNLVNAWGISFSPTSPFWISDNGTGLATLYAVTNDTTGGVVVAKVGLQVTIPGEGNVTGQLFNNTPAFNGDLFIFASEDGTISGWRGALGTTAEVLATRPGAVYKGITLSSNASGPLLLAANFSEGTLDAYDATMHLIGQFADSRAQAGYAPFNVQSVAGMAFVTFARQDAGKKDDVQGPGHGLIDVFNPATGKFHRFATGSDAGGRLREINSPWGVALAPATFGKNAGQLMVGNFGSGTIMAFEADGDFKGLLKSCDHGPVVIEGLWSLTFGNGGRAGNPDTLYFTAGPADENHGLFGNLTPTMNNGHGMGDDGQ
jgi:uncharacterized protein (TIGR03118 family)